MCITGAIDVRKDRLITQFRERRIGGNKQIRVDAGKLDTAVPDIAIDVARKIGGREDRNQTADDGGTRQQDSIAARDAGRPRKPTSELKGWAGLSFRGSDQK